MEFNREKLEAWLSILENKWSNRDLKLAGILDEVMEDGCEDIDKFNNFVNIVREEKITFNDEHINSLNRYIRSEKRVDLPIPIRVQLLELSIDR